MASSSQHPSITDFRSVRVGLQAAINNYRYIAATLIISCENQAPYLGHQLSVLSRNVETVWWHSLKIVEVPQMWMYRLIVSGGWWVGNNNPSSRFIASAICILVLAPITYLTFIAIFEWHHQKQKPLIYGRTVIAGKSCSHTLPYKHPVSCILWPPCIRVYPCIGSWAPGRPWPRWLLPGYGCWLLASSHGAHCPRLPLCRMQ